MGYVAMSTTFRQTQKTELGFYEPAFEIVGIKESYAPGQRGGEYIDGYVASLRGLEGANLSVKLRRDDPLLGALLYMFHQPGGNHLVKFTTTPLGTVIASGVVQ